MTDRRAVRDRLVESGVIAVLRGVERERIVPVARAIADGGATGIEITADAPGTADTIAAVDDALREDGAVVGVGTVLDAPTAAAAIDAGAEFVVSPHTAPDVLDCCNRRNVLSMAGVMTPTEAVTALEAGADVLKVFPAATVGPGHLAALRGPFGDIDLVPTGGVTLENLADFVDAGAVAVGVGSSLVEYEAIADGDYGRLEARAARFVDAVEAARDG